MFEDELENLIPEENIQDPDVSEETVIVRDKIFQNTYDEIELDTYSISFKVDPSYETESYEYTIDEKIIYRKIEEVLKNSIYEKILFADENQKYKKLSKIEINQLYQFIIIKLSSEPKIEIFSVLSSFFDINPNKLYESLSNTFKTGLILELKERGYLHNRKSLF